MVNQKIKKVADTPIWKLAIRFMFSFAFILIIVFTAAELFKNGNLNAISESFEDGSWIQFVLIRITVIIGYGFVMAFLTKSKAKNKI
ncbi:hypothetical protein [Wenyingzhuangia sp. 2_MG-2023]|uniref:hypothetical protein n=1 Tax=Wenyingzhuangia sp. 2_MG-2023 TaxID=3062639 RepID=UPI0026E30370|nr:hypothetical protein [Wenyingzhuangia sp. 2_MG-2023]MDO6737732.1 hypothetical protein [Wenyingzhuangia sp. 2_MG-2023]MDO6802571.1 hypothetical protein [Wenyingzhuangia sp. 1_MG-2023]